jgi:hypothetical protein
MPNQPKNHHYVPSFHLSLFTTSETADGELFVLDKQHRRKWVSTPRKTGRANNFYRVEADEGDPMGMEKVLSFVEDKCAPVVLDVVTNKRLPTGVDFDVLLNFVALSFVRVPSIRATTSDFIDRVGKSLARLAFLGDDGAKRLRSNLEAAERKLSDDELKKLQAFVESDDYTVNLDQNWHIQLMRDSVGVLLPALAKRHWAVWTVADGAPDLVCSDRPVTLWQLDPHPLIPPGFGTPNTVLTIPLSRRVLLVSRFEDLLPTSFELDAVNVALMNTFRATWASQIYSEDADWAWTVNGELLSAQAYLDGLPAAETKKDT